MDASDIYISVQEGLAIDQLREAAQQHCYPDVRPQTYALAMSGELGDASANACPNFKYIPRFNSAIPTLLLN